MRPENQAPLLLMAWMMRCPLPSTYAFEVLVAKVVGQLLGFPEYPGGPQYVSISWLPKPPFPRSKAHTVVSGGPGVVALNSWHHCGLHVTDPVVLGGTPLQPCARHCSAPAPKRNRIARTYLPR